MQENGSVIVDYVDRKNKIAELLNSVSSEHKLTHVISERLLDDITSLCEWPIVYIAEFNNKFPKFARRMSKTDNGNSSKIHIHI